MELSALICVIKQLLVQLSARLQLSGRLCDVQIVFIIVVRNIVPSHLYTIR
jgi:hypothetical protein